MKKTSNIVAIFCSLTAIIFVVTLYALTFQIMGVDTSNKATIFSGVLSMIGGFAGALGAYFVASNQMKKQFEYEKSKEYKKSKERTLHTLKKLKVLNEDAIDFVNYFGDEFIELDAEEMEVKLKVREYDLQYIVNKVEKINDDILSNDYHVDYLKFSRELNNMYIDIISFTHIPEKYKILSIEDLRESVIRRNESFISFDTYINQHIHDIQKELTNLNK